MIPQNNKDLTRKHFIENLYKPFCEANDIQYFNDYSKKLVKAYSKNKEDIRSQLCEKHNIDHHKIISGTHFTIFAFLGIKPNSITTQHQKNWANNSKLINENINFALFIGIMILHKWTNTSIKDIEHCTTKENFKTEHKKWLYRLVKKNHQNDKKEIDMNDVYGLSQIWYLIEEIIKETKTV